MGATFCFQKMFQLGEDRTDYRLLTGDYVSTETFMGKRVVVVERDALVMLAKTAFKEVSHLLRPSHLEQLAAIVKDPQSSENDRYVARELIKNAVIASGYVFPLCQDTGTAIVIGRKGQAVWTGFCDEEALSRGVFEAYQELNLRYSQVAPITMYEERNTGTNLPAQVEIYATEGDAYGFLFIAKGGGSANKTFLFQKTKAVLNPQSLVSFLKEEIGKIGTAACPPYHLAVVVGGTSAEANLKTVKLASAGYLDGLPEKGGPLGHAFRDRELEAELLRASFETGLGAQFGGKYLCRDVKVIRLPRHGASCPVGIGLSCSADRNIKAKITHDGIYIERLETDPAKYLPDEVSQEGEGGVRIDLDRPLDRVREELSRYPVGTRLLLNGRITVARDMAHARVAERLDAGEPLPSYFTDHVILYAGPAKTPEGYPSGSFGPTTSARMDPYLVKFQKHGGSLVTLGKGNRSAAVVESCKENGGFYLGTIGGAAALLARCITHVETIDFPEFGMEAVRMITVKDFPAFILIDDKGGDFFSNPPTA